MKKFLTLILLAALIAPVTVQAAPQSIAEDSVYRRPVASFLIPLQLDSLFPNNRYRFGNNIPRNVLPYLEYYNGLRLAIDSLNEEGIDAHIQVIDTRPNGGLQGIFQSSALRRSDMLIGIALNTADLREMSDFARNRNIPFISTTFPNDGGIVENPSLYILNPTLKTHIFSSYRFLKKMHSRDNLLVMTRRGNAEPYLKAWIDEAAAQDSSQSLNLQFHTLNDSFSIQQILPLLDSNRTNIIWGATLTDAFARRLAKMIAPLSVTYPVAILGMPTWDGIDFTGKDYNGLDVFLSTPFISSMGNAEAYTSFNRRYNNSQHSRPSDMASKGYEFAYRLVKALARDSLSGSSDSLLIKLNHPEMRIFNEVEFQPVYAPGKPGVINYYENRKLYFIHKNNGAVRAVF